MKRLFLLRHAKAVPDAAGGDHERSLNMRGRSDAETIGREIARRGFIPDLALCSTARRTSETLAIAAAFLAPSPQVRMEPGLYHASPEDILAHLARTLHATGAVLVVGHNPGLQDLAAALAGSDRIARRIEEKFPTAAFAAFECDAADWRQAAEGSWTVTDLIRVSEI